MMKFKKWIICLSAIWLHTGFAQPKLNEPIRPIPENIKINQPLLQLGSRLFHDKRLSKNAKVSCASCHQLAFGLADDKDFSISATGEKRARNTQSLFNVYFFSYLHWDGKFNSLTDLSLRGMQGAVSNNWDNIINFLTQNKDYQNAFNALFPDGITKQNTALAIAEYLKSYNTPNSRFDLYLKGDESAINALEKKGYQLFKDYGCISCHNGLTIGGQMFAKLGQFGDYFQDRGQIKKSDYGRFNRTKIESDRYKFRVPSLRNIALTAPYFHDATQKTLDDAVQTMAQYQLGRQLSKDDINAIVSFLKTLTGQLKGKQL